MEQKNKKKVVVIGSVILIGILAVWGFFLVLNSLFSKVSNHIADTSQPLALTRDENDLTDADYYESVEDAMQHAAEYIDSKRSSENMYKCKVDEVILQLQNDLYTSVYYKAVKNKEEICFIYAKFKIKTIGGKKKYAYLTHTESVDKASYYGGDDAQESLDLALKASAFASRLNIDPKNTRFVYGSIKKDALKDGKSIEKLRVEGQKPDGIVEYQRFDETWYLWYYTNLKSSKAAGELKGTLE